MGTVKIVESHWSNERIEAFHYQVDLTDEMLELFRPFTNRSFGPRYIEGQPWFRLFTKWTVMTIDYITLSQLNVVGVKSTCMDIETVRCQI